jgi:DNA polymerase-3 subunit gamma/tau
MYQVIALKYRPHNFAELIGQEHVRSTLGNAISGGRIAHGYIFSGQRGTGKTSVARILARCLNCEKGPTAEPCNECVSCREIGLGSCVDVIEIDAASNRGINEMRELRENVRYRPARERYKVFIVDEAHQITTEAFNALLKTLEEPPEWVVFILCTTESHKIPTTIASRCQQFSFRSVDFAEVVGRMQYICDQEGITTDEDTLAVLAQAGEGSVRDSLSALDQAIACCGTKLNAAEVRTLLGLYSLDMFGDVSRALVATDSRAMLELVGELERNGHNLQHFCRELARYFRNLLVAKISGGANRLIAASQAEQSRMVEVANKFSEDDLTRYLQLTLDLYRDLQYSLQPRLHLEIGLLRLIHASRVVDVEKALASLGSGGSQAPPRPPQTPPRTSPPPTAAPVRQAQTKATGDFREKLLADLEASALTFIIDAVDHAAITEAPGEVRFTAPREFKLALKSNDLKNAVARAAGKPLRITIVEDETAADNTPAKPAAAPQPTDDETTGRALSHPEVQRFQELFPGSRVGAVRNLKQ